MSELTNNLDDGYPEYDWYESEFDYFVEDAATRGIDIALANRNRKSREHGISFSGFWSQGDGLAFDATINWPVFIEKNPRFKINLPEWFLVIVANPDFIQGGVKRSGRNENIMSINIDINSSDPIESGFFAGVEIGSIPQLYFEALELEVLHICEAEARQMYKSLEATYIGECAYIKDQRIENILEENKVQLQKCLAVLLFSGESFTNAQACTALDFDDNWIDQNDLNCLGLTEYRRVGEPGAIRGLQVTEKGKELLRE